jgi:hypothetical protein
MSSISAFDILVLGHLVGDFLFQNQWMAANKQKKVWPLLVHSSVYTVIVYAFSLFLLDAPLSIWGVMLIFAGHIFLDQGSFIRFWHRRIAGCTDPKSWWLRIVHDQIFHLILLYAALWI